VLDGVSSIATTRMLSDLGFCLRSSCCALWNYPTETLSERLTRRGDDPAHLFRFSVVSPLGHGVRSLTLFGKPLMADDTEITVFPSSIP
jgi:hypothetical protein